MREQAGLTQEQVAKKIGVSPRAYAFWERRPVALRADQLAMLAESLRTSTDFLTGIRPLKVQNPGPKGKMRKLFEEASSLSRDQQQKVIALLEAFVERHINGHKNAE